MGVKHYQELIVWQKSMDLVVAIYETSMVFPKGEIFGLTSQIRRAGVSIPSNIAEGQGRSTTKDFAHFLCTARGSLQEVETQILIAERLRYVTEHARNELVLGIAEVGRLINGLLNALQSN